MMYNQKMVACLKANGKVLRENGDEIYIPFGSEYSVYLKNLNSRRAIVNISIDGVDVAPGGFVINANSELDLERFIKEGNLAKGNRFKFIERTANIENHRGVKAEDGLVRISFQYERVYANSYYPLLGGTYYPPGVRSWPYLDNTPWYGTTQCNAAGTTCTTSASNGGVTYTNASGSVVGANSAGTLRSSAMVNHVSNNDVGITVPGSESNQKFQSVYGFATEAEEHVMILRLKGETETGKVVYKPITVKIKPKCQTCGRVNKATSKFCAECGTAVEIV